MKNSATQITNLDQRILSLKEIIPPIRHNAFTDCHMWKGQLWLAFRSATRRFAGHLSDRKSCIVIMHTIDGKIWKRVAEISGRGWDIRDPKFFVIEERIFLYALLNTSIDPKPIKTVYTVSTDGYAWAEWKDAAPEGRLLGKPIAVPGYGYYSPAHDIKRKNVCLMKLSNTFFWEPGQIISSEGDETAIAAIPGGGLIAIIRIEEKRATGITKTSDPDSPWTEVVIDSSNRLDGPCLFFSDSFLYAIGRRLVSDSRTGRSSSLLFGRMRTALFFISNGKLNHLFDFPSSGDTGYAGIAQFQDVNYITYYSSPPNLDYSWLRGMLGSCGIYVATFTNNILRVPEVSGKESI